MNPRTALQDPDRATLFHQHIHDLAPWYDLSDAPQSFAKVVPAAALVDALLSRAVIAFAAIHLSRTTQPSRRAPTSHYPTRCVERLINLSEEGAQSSPGVALAAVCLLRSYEILEEETDPSRHLAGAYSFLSAIQPADTFCSSLGSAGFSNNLRKDIIYSLVNTQPLKIALGGEDASCETMTDKDQLKTVSLHLARVLHAGFSADPSDAHLQEASRQLKQQSSDDSDCFLPYADTFQVTCTGASPIIWKLREFSVATTQHRLVAESLLE